MPLTASTGIQVRTSWPQLRSELLSRRRGLYAARRAGTLAAHGRRGAAALRSTCIVLAGELPVTTGPQDPAAAGRDRLRAGHADREQVIGMLKTAFVHGQLTKDELDTRAGQALTARTYADLAALTADIPPGPARSRAGAPARPGTPPAAGQGGHRVGRLPDHRGRRHMGPLPPRSRRPPHSLWLGCQAAVPGLSRRRRRSARHLGVRGGRLMGAQALPQSVAAPAGAGRPHPRRRTARRHRPGSRFPPIPAPTRPAPTCALTSHGSVDSTFPPGRPGTPWRETGARRGMTLRCALFGPTREPQHAGCPAGRMPCGPQVVPSAVAIAPQLTLRL